MADRMTAEAMRRAIYRRFSARYAVVFEVAAASDDARWRGNKQRRIDALLVRRAPLRHPATVLPAAPRPAVDHDAGLFALPTTEPAPLVAEPGDDGGIERLALEIKVTRGDFLSDVRCPDKQASWRGMAHRHAYAVPEGLVRVEEVPAESGLLAVSPFGNCRWLRSAPRSPTLRPLPVAVVLDAFWRWSRAEAAAKGLVNREDDGDAEAMRLELERLCHEKKLLDGRYERAREDLAAWKKRYALHDPPACGTCGELLRPSRKRTSYTDFLLWEHPPAVEAVCQPLRHAVALAEHMQRPADRRWGFRVPGPEPRYPGDPKLGADTNDTYCPATG